MVIGTRRPPLPRRARAATSLCRASVRPHRAHGPSAAQVPSAIMMAPRYHSVARSRRAYTNHRVHFEPSRTGRGSPPVHFGSHFYSRVVNKLFRPLDGQREAREPTSRCWCPKVAPARTRFGAGEPVALCPGLLTVFIRPRPNQSVRAPSRAPPHGRSFHVALSLCTLSRRLPESPTLWAHVSAALGSHAVPLSSNCAQPPLTAARRPFADPPWQYLGSTGLPKPLEAPPR